eukprot:scaffold10934_cov71-Phaeocystis_antarctica.AAC.3
MRKTLTLGEILAKSNHTCGTLHRRGLLSIRPVFRGHESGWGLRACIPSHRRCEEGSRQTSRALDTAWCLDRQIEAP